VAKRILVTDDDIQTLRLIGYILRGQGYEVSEAMSGAEALRSIALNKPDLMVLDVMMPDLDGYEVCRRVRSDPKTSNLPVVLLTAKAQASDRAEGLLAGADDYITKPIDPVDLAVRIKAVFHRPRTDRLAAEQTSGDLLSEIAHGTVMMLAASLVWVLAVEEDSRTLKSAAIAGTAGEDVSRLFLRNIRGGAGEVSYPLAKQVSPLCEVVLTDQSLIEQTTKAIARMTGGESLARALEVAGAQVASLLPLTLRGQTLGVMMVARRGETRLSASDLRLLTILGSQAAMAIENLRLVKRLEAREQEARRDKAFHQALVNTMGDGLLMLNRTSRINYVNRRLCRMLGYEENELLGRPLTDLIHEPDRTAADVWLSRVSSTSQFEKRLVRKNGTTMPVLAVHVPGNKTDIGDVIVVTDLTEQKNREAELMRRTRQVTAINSAARIMAASLDFDSIPQTILEETARVLGARAGSILLVDESASGLVFKAAVGPESQRLIGLKVPSGFGVIGWVAQNAKPALVDDVRKDPRFYRGIDQTTGLTTTNVIAVPLLIKRQVIGVLELINKTEGMFDQEDLSVTETLAQWAAVAIENARLVHDLKTRTQNLESAYGELKEADLLKDELIQNISHELRTPLTFVLGYVELLLSKELGPLTETQVKGLDIVRRKCIALTKVINDIVSLQQLRLTDLEREPVSLNAIVSQTVQAVRTLAQQSEQTLTTELPAEEITLVVDEERITQVLDNLLNNAIKFSRPRGQIVVRLQDAGEEVQVEVQDSGIGIPADKLGKVFEKFYQVDGGATRRYGGVGLGLAICKEIVEAHGGRIWAESELGQGSRFVFVLPKVAVEAPVPEPAAEGS
jgi:PAS domain S-box-containing protein